MDQLISLIASIISITKTLKPFLDRRWRSFPWADRASCGIIERSQLSKGKRLAGEVFAAELLKEPIRRGIVQMKGKAYVNGQLASEAEMMAQIVKEKNND